MPPFRTAGVSQERSKLMEVGAVPTSLQLFNQVDLQAVMKAGTWSSGGTFTSLYLRDLCPQDWYTQDWYTQDWSSHSRRREHGDFLLGYIM